MCEKLKLRDGLCCHCKDGRKYKNELNTLLQTLHQDCSTCKKDETCPKYQTFSSEKKLKIQDLKEKIEKFSEHEKLYQHQEKQYDNDIEQLKVDECIVVQDFSSKFHTVDTINQSQMEWFNLNTTNDLVLTLITKLTDDKLKYQYFNYFSEDKNDSLYVKCAWMQFIEDINLNSFKKVIIWSDGGPKHFKCAKNLYFFSTLFNSKVVYNFFASCHGKGPCDSHLGVIKRRLKEFLLEKDITSVEDIINVVKLQPNSNGVEIEIDPTLNHKVTKLPEGIKKYHNFTFENTGVIKCNLLTNDSEEPTIQRLAKIPDEYGENDVKYVCIGVDESTEEEIWELVEVKKQVDNDGNKKVRKCGNCKQPGHTQSKCKAPCSFCGSVQHVVNKCNAPK